MRQVIPSDGQSLDHTDRRIILAIYRHRRDDGAGPTWHEVRKAVGIEHVDTRWQTFAEWWGDAANRSRLAHYDPDLDTGRRQPRSPAYRVWRSRQYEADPLNCRLHRLKALGYVRYSNEPRSLQLGPRVRDWLRQRQGQGGSCPCGPPGRLRRLLGAHRRLLGRSGTEPELPRTDRAGPGNRPGAALMWRWSVMPDYLPPIEVTNDTPALHRVLVPGEVLYVYGFLGHSRELPDVPMMIWLGRDAGGDPAHAVDSRTMDPRRVPRPRLVNRVVAADLASMWGG